MITVITYKPPVYIVGDNISLDNSDNPSKIRTIVTHGGLTIADDAIILTESETFVEFKNIVGDIIILDDNDLSKVREVVRKQLDSWRNRNVSDRIKIGGLK